MSISLRGCPWADPPPPIAALAPHHSIHIASLSKCLGPGLRIAYLAVPAHLRERAVDAVWSSIWNTAPLMAALASHWIGDGTLDKAVVRKREVATQRQALARDILFPGAHGESSAAYHLWLDLEGKRDATHFTAEASALGIRVTPAAAFHIGQPKAIPQAVRLALGAAPSEKHLRRGLEVLARLLRSETDPRAVRA